MPSYLLIGTGGGGKTKTSSGTTEAGDEGEEGEEAPPRPEKEDRNYAKAVCQCETPTVIRVSVQRRKIMCGECMASFALAD
ncbi:hypothetical protein ACF06X_34080 [Streptomyces sp. NPDC015346]|uniref:hypothetical protein n=1 Tax=Streptomyces sp. NPDC015346 TaxID=3364954 RepID=UPI0037008877